MPVRTKRVVTAMAFVVDPKSIVRSSGRQIDWAAWPARYRSGVAAITLTAAAAAAAGAIAVAALPVALPAGALLHFGEAGENIRTTEARPAGYAGNITTDPLPVAVENGDVAYYGGGDKVIPAGTVAAENAAGLLIPRDGVNPARGILEATAEENEPSAALTGYGMILGGILYGNMLPDATGGPPKALPAPVVTELRTNGYAWAFEVYEDSVAAAA